MQLLCSAWRVHASFCTSTTILLRSLRGKLAIRNDLSLPAASSHDTFAFQEGEGQVGVVMQRVHQGMRDDLNTPQTLSALSAPLKAMNDLLSTKKGKKADTLAQYQLALQETLSLLGMQVAQPQEQLNQMRQLALSRCLCMLDNVYSVLFYSVFFSPLYSTMYPCMQFMLVLTAVRHT